MGTKFSEFKGKKSGNRESEQPRITPERETELENTYNHYSGMGESDLMSEFLRLSKEKMKAGELNEPEIAKMKDSLFPYLTPEQQQRFNQLMGFIKK